MAFTDFVKWLWSRRLRENKDHKKYISIFYAFLTWNAVLFTYYQMCAEKNFVTTEDQKAVLMERHNKQNNQVKSVVIRGFSSVQNETHNQKEDEITDLKLGNWARKS